MRIVQPPEWPRPKEHSNGVVAQARRALTNIASLPDEAGSKPEHIVCMSGFVGDGVKLEIETTAVIPGS
jgi:enamine deaminase RidA (YjgF/YER057c/UK114 family)